MSPAQGFANMAMPLRSLGGTGLRASPLTWGTMEWGGKVAAATARCRIDLAWEHGVNGVETAVVTPVG